VVNSLLNRDREADAIVVLRKLAKFQNSTGVINGAQTSITQSSGRDLQIETTALALVGWLKHNRPEVLKNTDLAHRWLTQQRGGYGGFGSTQATILTLKALVAHARRAKQTAEPGVLTLFIGNKEAARLPFKAGVSDALVLNLDRAEEILKP